MCVGGGGGGESVGKEKWEGGGQGWGCRNRELRSSHGKVRRIIKS